MYLFFSKIEIEITKGEILHNDIDVIIVLESFFYGSEEMMISHKSYQFTL
jgi:hypothetical protein